MKYINNWINGLEVKPSNNSYLEKFNPHNGLVISKFANSSKEDVNLSVEVADNKFKQWKSFTPIKRGEILLELVNLMKTHHQKLCKCFALETGKPMADAIGELNGAIKLGIFFSGEGMRLYGKSLTSGIEGKQSFTIREPRGVAGLIVPANTPIANIAWKVFPALICGNTVVLKSSEDAPEIAIEFAKLTKAAGIPDGVFNVIHGSGNISGQALVEHRLVSTISFTGSTNVGKVIASACSRKLTRVSLELGGKNPFVVCDDADIDNAVDWAILSAFSNAGQRCAAASRIIVFEKVYNQFVEKLITKANSLKLGIDETSNLGPLITKKQQITIQSFIDNAIKSGGRVLCGGRPPIEINLSKGNYFLPTLIDNISVNDEISQIELFGPVATLYSVKNLDEALQLANNTIYGLTSCIHTKDINKAMYFTRKINAGVVNVNMGTYGSEPHMPFGGFGESGNGTREPGFEALDFYSEIKNISIVYKF
ncbi:MAG: aldehyde dehydrogenase family protein [Flavobacterium sp.]|uniref:aldehyde dehydrogenase family protein n=1 Tax=Flavobacterium sp. TaxID=239 RepID=UPI003BD5A576